MQNTPAIALQISETPTLTSEKLRRLFAKAKSLKLTPEQFVERAISDALESKPKTAKA